MDEFIKDIPRYRKKSKKKPPKKSDHKHVFELCIFEYPRDWYKKSHEQSGDNHVAIGSYCPLCGKVGNFKWESEFVWFNEPMPEEVEMEINPETRTLPTFWCVEGPFQKFVDIKE